MTKDKTFAFYQDEIKNAIKIETLSFFMRFVMT